MDKFKEIRPIALGLATKNNKLLVGEGFDDVRNETFYRCLGGGIEFLEESSDALKREFKEEIGANIAVNDFLGIYENIFTYQGKKAHELILFYSIDISDEDFKEEYIIDIDKRRFYCRLYIFFYKSTNSIQTVMYKFIQRVLFFPVAFGLFPNSLLIFIVLETSSAPTLSIISIGFFFHSYTP